MPIINIDGRLIINTDEVNMTEVRRYSGRYEVTNYIVDVSDEVKEECWSFAQRIILGGNQFDRLLPAGLSDEDIAKLRRIQRTYCGKIAEVAFAICAAKRGHSCSTTGMLTIYPGQRNVDSYDFITKLNETIDCKAAFRPIHRNLLVNLDQIKKGVKDYYVAVKLNAEDLDPSNKIISPDSINQAEIWGYADGSYINNLENEDFGEGECKALLLERTMGIDRLINQI